MRKEDEIKKLEAGKKCKYCGVMMNAVGLDFANGWQCPVCGHQEVEMGSAKIGGHYKEAISFQCQCNACIHDRYIDERSTHIY